MISKEDKADVSRAMGKALANKVSKVTNDSKMTAFKRSNPEMKAARKGYNDARAADGLSKHRGTFSIGGTQSRTERTASERKAARAASAKAYYENAADEAEYNKATGRGSHQDYVKARDERDYYNSFRK